MGALVCRPREQAGGVTGTSTEHETPFATEKGLQSFPTLIRQFGQSFLARDVMVTRDKIVYVEPGDLPAAKKIVAHLNFSLVPCSPDGIPGTPY